MFRQYKNNKSKRCGLIASRSETFRAVPRIAHPYCRAKPKVYLLLTWKAGRLALLYFCFAERHSSRSRVSEGMKHFSWRQEETRSLLFPSSHTRLASPEVVDRGLAESVLEPSIGVGPFKKDFFCLTQVWPLAWVLLLCRATVYDAGPALSSTCLVTGSITDSSHHISPDTRRYMRQGLINVEPMSQTVGQH